jgi:hypothetical protein
MSPLHALGRMLLILGLAAAAVGLLLLLWDKVPFLKSLWQKFPLGRLPGDIHIQRRGFGFHFPWVTCLIISVVLTLLFTIFRK